MQVTLFSSENVNLQTVRTDSGNPGIYLRLEGGHEILIWMPRDRATALRSALDELYPVEQTVPIHDASEPDHAARYADEHAGDAGTLHELDPSDPGPFMEQRLGQQMTREVFYDPDPLLKAHVAAMDAVYKAMGVPGV